MTRRALIVGGGIMGLCTGWALRRAGWEVEILEQDEVPNPRGSSVDRHRLIRQAYGAQVGYMRMVDEAFAAWEMLWQELGQTLYRQTGILAFCTEPSAWISQSLAALTADGRPVRVLDAEEMSAACPLSALPEGSVGLLQEQGGLLLADRIVAELGRLLRDCITKAKVVELDAERARVRLEPGAWKGSDLLVVAAGPWAPLLLPELAGRVVPSRQTVAYFEIPDDLKAGWAAAPAMINLSAESGFWAFPPVEGYGMKAGDHSFSLGGDPNGPRAVGSEEVEVIAGLCRRHLVGFERFRLIEAKACFYDVEPAEEFVIERLSRRTWMMSGFSGHGFKFGACLGLAMARAAEGGAAAERMSLWARGR